MTQSLPCCDSLAGCPRALSSSACTHPPHEPSRVWDMIIIVMALTPCTCIRHTLSIRHACMHAPEIFRQPTEPAVRGLSLLHRQEAALALTPMSIICKATLPTCYLLSLRTRHVKSK